MIEAKSVSLAIAGRWVLKDIRFDFDKGAMYGIIGPNGVGKSTLLRLLSGTERPTKGDVLLDGRPASGYKRKELAKRVAVLQQGGLPAVGFTVREAVRMGRFPYQNWLGEESHEGERTVERVLEDMGLLALQDRRVDGLSGGERQRVALAKVMAQEPELLLLDEPTTYLDIGYQVQLLDTVKRWQAERRLTVVAVLHDLNLAAHYCDKLLVLREGAVEAFGPPAEVVNPAMIRRVFGASTVVLPHPETGVPQLLLRPEMPPAANASDWQAGQGEDVRRSEGDGVLAERGAGARDGNVADAIGGEDENARDGKGAGSTDGKDKDARDGKDAGTAVGKYAGARDGKDAGTADGKEADPSGVKDASERNELDERTKINVVN